MAAKQEATSHVKPNRKQRRDQQRRIWTADPGLEVVHHDAAGIDVGNSEHYVAIAQEKSAEPVRKFGCFTGDLREVVLFLKAHVNGQLLGFGIEVSRGEITRCE